MRGRDKRPTALSCERRRITVYVGFLAISADLAGFCLEAWSMLARTKVKARCWVFGRDGGSSLPEPRPFFREVQKLDEAPQTHIRTLKLRHFRGSTTYDLSKVVYCIYIYIYQLSGNNPKKYIFFKHVDFCFW